MFIGRQGSISADAATGRGSRPGPSWVAVSGLILTWAELGCGVLASLPPAPPLSARPWLTPSPRRCRRILEVFPTGDMRACVGLAARGVGEAPGCWPLGVG